MAADIRQLFDTFVATDSASAVLSSFAALRDSVLSDEPTTFYPTLRDALLPNLPYKHKALFDSLNGRWTRTALLRERVGTSNAESPRRVLISGAGPCGLRAAVESCLLGLPTTLVDLRTDFSRHNVLKTWQPTVDDALSLGLAAFVPGFKKHGVLNCPTRDLQACLLKAALLFGCEVRLGTGICGLLDPSFAVDGVEHGQPGQWRAWSLPDYLAREYLKKEESGTTDKGATTTEEDAPELALRPGEQDVSRLKQTSKVDFVEPSEPDAKAILSGKNGGLAPLDREWPLLVDPTENGSHASLIPFSVLLIAEGESSRLIRRLGFSRKVSRFANAIGIVCNLDFSSAGGLASSPERTIPERVVSRASADWSQTVLGPLAETGIKLENLEYLRGTRTHFIAATTRISDLLPIGIVRSDRGRVKETLKADNLDLDELRELARTLARGLGIPDGAALSSKHGVQIFDFSARGLCSEPYRVLESSGPNTLVLPIGDALQNPYWPQGLGINRGFHNALDGIWAAYLSIISDPSALEERIEAFKTMDYLTFSAKCLSKADGWTADPATRYSYEVYRRRHFDDTEAGRASGVLGRVREKLGLRDAVGGDAVGSV